MFAFIHNLASNMMPGLLSISHHCNMQFMSHGECVVQGEDTQISQSIKTTDWQSE